MRGRRVTQPVLTDWTMTATTQRTRVILTVSLLHATMTVCANLVRIARTAPMIAPDDRAATQLTVFAAEMEFSRERRETARSVMGITEVNCFAKYTQCLKRNKHIVADEESSI